MSHGKSVSPTLVLALITPVVMNYTFVLVCTNCKIPFAFHLQNSVLNIAWQLNMVTNFHSIPDTSVLRTWKTISRASSKSSQTLRLYYLSREVVRQRHRTGNQAVNSITAFGQYFTTDSTAKSRYDTLPSEQTHTSTVGYSFSHCS